MDVYYLDNFFNKLNSKLTSEHLVDSWKVIFNYPDKKVEKLMLNYFGLGCDGQVAKTLDIMRKRYPFLFRINKITRLFYAGAWFKNFFKELYYGKKSSKLTNIEAEIDGKRKRVDHVANLVTLNCYSRQGGLSHEWDKYRVKPQYKDRNFKPWSDQDQTLEIHSIRDYFHLGGTTIHCLPIDLFA